jgi:hypothetical protein
MLFTNCLPKTYVSLNYTWSFLLILIVIYINNFQANLISLYSANCEHLLYKVIKLILILYFFRNSWHK